MKRKEKKNYGLLSETERLTKQLLFYKMLVLWTVVCLVMNVAQAYVLPNFDNAKAETVTEERQEGIAPAEPSEMVENIEPIVIPSWLEIFTTPETTLEPLETITEWLTSIIPIVEPTPVDITESPETTASPETEPHVVIKPSQTATTETEPYPPTPVETTTPTHVPVSTQPVATTTPESTPTQTTAPTQTTKPTTTPVTTESPKPVETTTPTTTPVTTPTTTPVTTPPTEEPKPTTQPVETTTPTTEPEETWWVYTPPQVCTMHNYVFDHQETYFSYQVYSCINKTYKCTVCGETKTELVTVVNHGVESNMESQIAGYINNLRASKGLSTLWVDNGTFKTFARTRAKEISYCFGHSRPDGSENSTSDGTYYVILENINAGGCDAEDVFNAFKNSPSHCRAMLYEDAVGVAVGVYISEEGTAFTQVSIISAY